MDYVTFFSCGVGNVSKIYNNKVIVCFTKGEILRIFLWLEKVTIKFSVKKHLSFLHSLYLFHLIGYVLTCLQIIALTIFGMSCTRYGF